MWPQELWSLLNPELDSVEDMPETLTQSPPFTGQSYDVGESAVVVVDRSRNRPAMDVLRRMCSPDLITVLWDYILGDKVREYVSLQGGRRRPVVAIGCGDCGA